MKVSRQQLDAVVELLCTRFPKTFVMYQARRRPLKVGIARDLEAVLGNSVDSRMLCYALKYYAREFGYQMALRPGAERIDLDGNAAGSVTEDQAQHAKKTIKAKKNRDGSSALRASFRNRQQAAAGGGA